MGDKFGGRVSGRVKVLSYFLSAEDAIIAQSSRQLGGCDARGEARGRGERRGRGEDEVSGGGEFRRYTLSLTGLSRRYYFDIHFWQVTEV